MGIGQKPLIPLYRVQPDPQARFQRFGTNDSQLIGKPLLSLPAARPPVEQERIQEPPEQHRRADREGRFAPSMEASPDYTRPKEGHSLLENDAPKGALVDLKA